MSLPKPYYEHDGQTIYLGDCRDILPELPKVDLVLTDPPYGINEDGKVQMRGDIVGTDYVNDYALPLWWCSLVKSDSVVAFTDQAKVTLLINCLESNEI